MVSSRLASVVIALMPFVSLTQGQLSQDEVLTPNDEQELTGELKRLEALLLTANNKCAVQLQIANTYAAGGRFSDAVQRLREIVTANYGFDPSRDPDFAKLKSTAEFQLIARKADRQNSPVTNSRPAATLNSDDTRPENIAFDTKRNAFLLGNTSKFQILRCSLLGECRTFATADSRDGGYVLGLKVDETADTVWVTQNTNRGANLRCYGLADGKLRRTASIRGKHVFNDLTIASSGIVYVTDTAEGSIYRLGKGSNMLRRIAARHTFTGANGLTMSPDEKFLYVSAWEDGVAAINLRTEAVSPLIHPSNVCLAFIDGLYATGRSLVAVQNGPMSPRIVEFVLDESGAQITSVRLLERRNPDFDGITTGVLASGYFYYVANPQTDKAHGKPLRALRVLRVAVNH